MLDAPDTKTLDAPAPSETVQGLRDLLERVQAELKFQRTRNEALNFELARLKRWRFGSSSESLDTTTQAVLFDSLLIDTALEDRAADEANKSPASPPRSKGQAVRQALPASLPRVEHTTTRSPRPTAPAVKPSSASAKRSASNWTACRLSSSCCATSAANTPVPAARRLQRRPCPRR